MWRSEVSFSTAVLVKCWNEPSYAQHPRQVCSSAFESSLAVVSYGWIWFSSFKKMASDTCCFCAGGIIILLGVIAPLELHILVRGGLVCSALRVPAPCSLSAVLLRQALAPFATFLVWCFLSALGYCCSGRDPALLILLQPWHGHGEQR